MLTLENQRSMVDNLTKVDNWRWNPQDLHVKTFERDHLKMNFIVSCFQPKLNTDKYTAQTWILPYLQYPRLLYTTNVKKFQ